MARGALEEGGLRFRAGLPRSRLLPFPSLLASLRGGGWLSWLPSISFPRSLRTLRGPPPAPLLRLSAQRLACVVSPSLLRRGRSFQTSLPCPAAASLGAGLGIMGTAVQERLGPQGPTLPASLPEEEEEEEEEAFPKGPASLGGAADDGTSTPPLARSLLMAAAYGAPPPLLLRPSRPAGQWSTTLSLVVRTEEGPLFSAQAPSQGDRGGEERGASPRTKSSSEGRTGLACRRIPTGFPVSCGRGLPRGGGGGGGGGGRGRRGSAPGPDPPPLPSPPSLSLRRRRRRRFPLAGAAAPGTPSRPPPPPRGRQPRRSGRESPPPRATTLTPMAPAARFLFLFLFLFLLALALASAAPSARTGPPRLRLRLRGRESGPILEGSDVTLECLFAGGQEGEGGEGAAGLAFQKYGQWLHAWVSLEKGSKLPCCFYDVVVSQEGGRLLLTIRSVQSWHAGTYRCLSSNATSNASSAELDLQIEYLHGIFLSRANSWCGTVGDSVTVLEGDDLELRCSAEASRAPLYEWSREGEDWIVASSSLALAKVNQEQAGIYTCRARHPSVAQLAKSKSLRLFVEGSQRGLVLESALSLSTPTLALTVGLPALLLLMVIAVFALLIVRLRGQAAAKKKAAQEDPGQRTPIYKDSLESVPSVVRDTHPLVM